MCIRDSNLTEARPEEWLLIEWPDGEDEPTKYWLSTLPKDVSFCRLVDTAKLRWRIERDYQELKQELSLIHIYSAVPSRHLIVRHARLRSPRASFLTEIG